MEMELTEEQAITSATKLRSMCARSRCYTVGDIKEYLDSLAQASGTAQRARYSNGSQPSTFDSRS